MKRFRPAMQRLQLVVALGTLLFASSASATTITVFDGIGAGDLRSDWEAAVSQIVLENYNDNVSNGFTISFLGTSHDGALVPAGILGAVHDRITLTNSTVFQFFAPIFGFGADWNLAAVFGPGFGIEVEAGGTIVGEIPNSHNGEFWGFVSDTPFTTMILRGGTQAAPFPAETYFQDDAVFAPVPEPSATLAFAVGLIASGLGIRSRRR